MNRFDHSKNANAEENQDSHKKAEALALALLLGRITPTIKRPAAFRKTLTEAILDVRKVSALAGSVSARRELAKLGMTPAGNSVSLTSRKSFFSAQKTAERGTSALLDRAAGLSAADSMSVMRPRLERIAASESAAGYGAGKLSSFSELVTSGILKVWDATLDRRTCRVCEYANGETVRIDESFSGGEPGAVHTSCRCSWYIIGRNT